MIPPVYYVNTQEDVVYLTFDDGPYVPADVSGENPRASATTGELLKVLRDLRGPGPGGVGDPDLSATFFVNGWTFVRPNPGDADDPSAQQPTERRVVAREILQDGHDLANHSHRHRNPWGGAAGTPTVEGMIQESVLCRTAIWLVDAVGCPGRVQPFLRAPGDPSYWPTTEEEMAQAVKGTGGRVPPQRVWLGADVVPEVARARLRKVVWVAQLMNLRYVSYNIMAHDSRPQVSADAVYQNVVRNPRFRADRDWRSFEFLPLAERRGAILLMHNGRKHTVEALPRIIHYFYDHQFRVRKVPFPATPG